MGFKVSLIHSNRQEKLLRVFSFEYRTTTMNAISTLVFFGFGGTLVFVLTFVSYGGKSLLIYRYEFRIQRYFLCCYKGFRYCSSFLRL